MRGRRKESALGCCKNVASEKTRYSIQQMSSFEKEGLSV